MPERYPGRTGSETPRPTSSPNIINQDDVGFMFQDLRTKEPRVWQAITSLKAFPAPQPFYAEIILGGKQKAKKDVLTHPCILQLPLDPYKMWKTQSVILIDGAISCKVPPKDSDYLVDILITRNQRKTYTSIFTSESTMPRLKPNSSVYVKYEASNFGTTELYADDEFRVDILQADSTVEDCWLILRGIANMLKDKPVNPNTQ